MVLNALGFSSRALYLMPEYLRNKPVDLLIRPGLTPDDFNDDTLGRSLDDLYACGATEIFARVASRALAKYKDKLDKRPYGKLFQEVYDLQTVQPTIEWLSFYNQVKEEAFAWGLPLE